VGIKFVKIGNRSIIVYKVYKEGKGFIKIYKRFIKGKRY
jgi:hypothetical protein